MRLMTRYLGDLGQPDGTRIVGFETFDGLPEDWIAEWPVGSFSQGGISVKVDGAYIIPGFFHYTLPHFFNLLNDDALFNNPAEQHFSRLTKPILKSDPRYPTKLMLVHIDCDLYSSTATVFENLQCGLRNSKIMTEPATKFRFEKRAWFYLAFDELIGYSGADHHKMKAFHEFMLDSPELSVEVIGMDGRTDVGEPLRFYQHDEPCPHRALFKIWGPEPCKRHQSVRKSR